jgi:hypothetical protein
VLRHQDVVPPAALVVSSRAATPLLRWRIVMVNESCIIVSSAPIMSGPIKLRVRWKYAAIIYSPTNRFQIRVKKARISLTEEKSN